MDNCAVKQVDLLSDRLFPQYVPIVFFNSVNYVLLMFVFCPAAQWEKNRCEQSSVQSKLADYLILCSLPWPPLAKSGSFQVQISSDVGCLECKYFRMWHQIFSHSGWVLVLGFAVMWVWSVLRSVSSYLHCLLFPKYAGYLQAAIFHAGQPGLDGFVNRFKSNPREDCLPAKGSVSCSDSSFCPERRKTICTRI